MTENDVEITEEEIRVYEDEKKNRMRSVNE
jgi:hypothetical protein